MNTPDPRSDATHADELARTSPPPSDAAEAAAKDATDEVSGHRLYYRGMTHFLFGPSLETKAAAIDKP